MNRRTACVVDPDLASPRSSIPFMIYLTCTYLRILCVLVIGAEMYGFYLFLAIKKEVLPVASKQCVARRSVVWPPVLYYSTDRVQIILQG